MASAVSAGQGVSLLSSSVITIITTWGREDVLTTGGAKVGTGRAWSIIIINVIVINVIVIVKSSRYVKKI